MNNTTILHLPPEKSIDQDWLKEALTKFPTVFGFGLQYENELVCESHTTSWKAEDVTAVADGAKAGHRILILGNWPKFKDVEDVPPFVLQDRDGNAILAIGFEGDFSDYSDSKSEHTDEMNAWNDELYPKLEKMFIEVGEDVDKFYAAIREDKFQKIVNKLFTHRGVFVMLPRVGDPILFGKNELGKDYSWGSVSNAHGLTYAEKVPEPPKEEPKSGSSFLRRVVNKATGSVAVADVPKPAHPVTAETPIITNNPKPEAPPTDTSIAYVAMKPPANLQGGARNFWLRTFNGKNPQSLPSDHQSKDCQVFVHPSLVEFAKRDISRTKDMKDLVEEMKSAKAGKPKDMKAPAPTSSKSTVREPGPTYTGTSTVLSAAEKEKACTMLAGFLEKKKSPIEIQKLESQCPKFSDEVGVSFNELLFISIDQVMQLFDGNKTATSAWIEMRRRYIETGNIKLEDLVSGAKGEEPKAVNTEAVNDKPSDKPVVAAQSGGLSFLRRPKAA